MKVEQGSKKGMVISQFHPQCGFSIQPGAESRDVDAKRRV